MRVKLLKSLTLSLAKGTEVELSEAQYAQVKNLVELLDAKAEVKAEVEVPKEEVKAEPKVETKVETKDVPKGIKKATK